MKAYFKRYRVCALHTKQSNVSETLSHPRRVIRTASFTQQVAAAAAANQGSWSCVLVRRIQAAQRDDVLQCGTDSELHDATHLSACSQAGRIAAVQYQCQTRRQPGTCVCRTASAWGLTGHSGERLECEAGPVMSGGYLSLFGAGAGEWQAAALLPAVLHLPRAGCLRGGAQVRQLATGCKWRVV